MFFNSIGFLIFFLAVFCLYLFLNHKWQNRMLLVASYFFYGMWDWRFLGLIFLTTCIDFFCGLAISRTENVYKRKLFLAISIILNLSILGFFKYFNFFISSLIDLFQLLGIQSGLVSLSIILPVGISFYIFQTMSYSIDIYRGKISPTKNFFDFALFVSFFPQLVAGPIERASHLLPQVVNERRITSTELYQGGYLIFWGLFQKMFVADNLAKIVDPIFAAPAPYNAWIVIIGLYAFAFQIYCDFAGYSKIAKGLCKCLGFDVISNFNLPYFAKNPQDFWNRWHISLTSWFRDYLYIPLGGNRLGKLRTHLNIIIVFTVSGLWHGAAWTYVFWGMYHGILSVIYRAVKPIFDRFSNLDRGRIFINLLSIVFFFQIICLGWLLFRAESMGQVVAMLQSFISDWTFSGTILKTAAKVGFFILPLLAIQTFQYWKKDTMVLLKAPVYIRTFVYLVLFYLLIMYGVTDTKEFIYFQF